jgi:hypothetical protein
MRSNILQRAVSSVRHIFGRDRHEDGGREEMSREERRVEKPAVTRTVRREADIPLDRLAQTYTPRQTSLKSSFRASGDDRQRDQEFANGVADDRWNDEDRFTNKSGDPRIGTHGRTYEPGE